MLSHAEILERRKPPRPRADPLEATDWGWRRMIASGPEYEVIVDVLGPGARKGTQRAKRGQQTLFVLAGSLWLKNGAAGEVRRVGRGQAITTPADSEFEIATGSEGAELLVIRSFAFTSTLEQVGTGNRLERRPATRSPQLDAPRKHPQPTFEERAARANAAQGLARVQPLPAQPRTATEVTGGCFNSVGVNLAPVVPEP